MLAQLSLASYQPQNARLMGKNWKIIEAIFMSLRRIMCILSLLKYLSIKCCMTG